MLREKGLNQRYAPENVIEISSLEGIYVHMSTFVSYYYKNKLQFYNDLDNVSKLNVDMQVNVFKKKRSFKQRKNKFEEQFFQSERYLK